MQAEQLCDGMQYLIKYIIIKAWMKMEDSILYNIRNEFPIWESPTFCTQRDTYSTHHCAHIPDDYDT
jgi:hypothetical protein